jgi:hypothetical protein
MNFYEALRANNKNKNGYDTVQVGKVGVRGEPNCQWQNQEVINCSNRDKFWGYLYS